MPPVRVAVAGSTGSIGTQTLDVIAAEGADRYQVVALGVGSSAAAVIEQARLHRPTVVAVSNPHARAEVAAALRPLGIDVVAELEALVEPADVVINGVVGFAGLPVTIETLRAGKRLGLANKESLIAAGPVVQPLRATPVPSTNACGRARTARSPGSSSPRAGARSAAVPPSSWLA
jgi:1-deoxy-D-xylulose-5-phosphate reductoisomerase